MKFWCSFFVCLLMACAAQAESFDIWLAHYKQRAIAAGLSPQIVNRALDGITPDADVIRLDRKQPEGRMTLLQYVDRTVNAKRIAKGQNKFNQHRSLLLPVEQRSGVPAEILVALWGKETDYGGYTGKSETITSLATLAHEGRRRAFFEQELLDAIILSDKLKIHPRDMRGSWAGAIGQCQFMPSNYMKFAQDGNGNGRADLWNEMPDVFVSMANLLVHEGWRAGQSWGQKITLPGGFDKSLIGRDKSPREFRFWEQRGVRFTKPVPASVQQKIRLYQPDGVNGPAYALYPNFDVLMRWNRSGYFAVAVGRLSDYIALAR